MNPPLAALDAAAPLVWVVPVVQAGRSERKVLTSMKKIKQPRSTRFTSRWTLLWPPGPGLNQITSPSAASRMTHAAFVLVVRMLLAGLMIRLGLILGPAPR